MSQLSSRVMSHGSIASTPGSINDLVVKNQQMMRLEYNTEEKEALKMPEYVLTRTPPRPPSITQDNYPYNQDTGSSEETTRKVESYCNLVYYNCDIVDNSMVNHVIYKKQLFIITAIIIK